MMNYSVRLSVLLLVTLWVSSIVAVPTVSDPNATVTVPPHIIFMLVDDWGWANFNKHRANDPLWEVQTPNLDSLADQGVLLNHHYVFKYCSPSRCAAQTGRNPIHVNVLNSPISQVNRNDSDGGAQGIPINMTTIATKIAPYYPNRVHVGKWNVGMSSKERLPTGRGYTESFHYFDYDNFFYNNTIGSCNNTPGVTDLWDTNGPAYGENNSWTCNQNNQPANCTFEEMKFTQKILQVLQKNNPSTSPLFLSWSTHAPHDPYESPDFYFQKFSNITQIYRRYYTSLVNLLDDQVGIVINELKSLGYWDNLLWIVTADNGGPIGDHYGGNNWPLRGGKASNLEGGVRSNAFITGGYVPSSVRGTVNEGFIAIEDWYTTICGIVGVDPTDEVAQKAGLPPVDGLNMWPFLSGQNSTSPRTEIILGSSANSDIQANGQTIVQGIIRNDGYKLLLGDIGGAIWQGPVYPNSSTYPDAVLDCKEPCLFNILDDPTEQENIATKYPSIVQELMKRLDYWNTTVYSPDRGNDDGTACQVAVEKYHGFWGPFIGV